MRLNHLSAREKDYVLTRLQQAEIRAGVKKGKRLPKPVAREIYHQARKDYAKNWK